MSQKRKPKSVKREKEKIFWKTVSEVRKGIIFRKYFVVKTAKVTVYNQKGER